MARITVEDCLEHVENRFILVLKAAKRARQLAMTGADAGVSWNNDKSTVVALREMGCGMTDLYERERARLQGVEDISLIQEN